MNNYKKRMSVFMAVMLTVIMLVSSTVYAQNTGDYLQRTDWSEDVRSALNGFIESNGKNSNSYDSSVYVVFDFDNTTSIFDVEEQLAVYQLQHMAFAVTPDNISEVLFTGLGDHDADLTELGYGKGSYTDWVDDITAAYSRLVEKYGQFTAAGLTDEDSVAIQKDDDWKEFSVKMRTMYDVVYDKESASVAYPWVTYWFTGMSEQEIYDLAYRSHQYYSTVETSKVTWKSPENYESKVGPVEYTWTSGVQVTENMKELMRTLNENGIHVWICSASYIDVIRAGIDYWGLHDYVSGVLAMTNKVEDGSMVNRYDYETGYGAEPVEGTNDWVKTDCPTGAQTQGEGKVTAIENTLCKEYGHGPSAGFMDSTGDFNFCTEFSSLQLVVCFNRANRKITDGGGLIAELAMYQRDDLLYDLVSANAAGDTLYVLQGRDENSFRTFRSSNSTIRYGETAEKLFANGDNEKQLRYVIEHQMSTQEVLDSFALKVPQDSEENLLGIKYGFLKEYRGYHSIP